MRPLPMLIDEDDHRAACKADRSNMFAAHFARQELGEKSSLDDMLENGLNRQDARSAAFGDQWIEATECVSIIEYGEAM